MQVIWLGTERRVTWQEAQIEAEASGRRRKVLEDSCKCRDTWDRLELATVIVPVAGRRERSLSSVSWTCLTLWPALIAARLGCNQRDTRRVVGEGLNEDP